jgi:hypothetical protein
MNQDAKTKDEGGAQERAQRDLTTSVGTPLVRQEKGGRRRLFGGRRKTRTSGS